MLILAQSVQPVPFSDLGLAVVLLAGALVMLNNGLAIWQHLRAGGMATLPKDQLDERFRRIDQELGELRKLHLEDMRLIFERIDGLKSTFSTVMQDVSHALGKLEGSVNSADHLAHKICDGIKTLSKHSQP